MSKHTLPNTADLKLAPIFVTSVEKKNIANRELAMSQRTQINRKKYWFVL